jgi:hypothetical protein
VFDNYRVIESTSEVSGEEFLFVLDTLDGHTARSENGTATLRAVGTLIRDTPAFVLYDAIGVDIEDHYAESMGISKDRLNIACSMLAHQPTDQISVPPEADAGLVAQADILYIAYPGAAGLITFKTRPKLVKTLQETYAKNTHGLRVNALPHFASATMPLAMLHQSVWNIDGYAAFPQLYANTPLWTLLLQAQSEILNLPRFGWAGYFMDWAIGWSWVTKKIFEAQVEGAKPIGFEEFNAFHHGGKVVKQDLATLEDLVRDGERVGRKMVALREIVKKGEERERVKEAERS